MFTVIALARIARGANREPPLAAAGDQEAGPQPDSVSVVIPARDEEDRLGPCLAALAEERHLAEVVVVDDESTDGTVAVGVAHRATIVGAGARPNGWAGKTWALQVGMTAATGQWVVALDADTRVKPGLIDAAVSAARSSHADLLTVGGRFDCAAAGERFLHPAMLSTLVYRFGPPGTRRPPRPSRTLANGQCMVVPRRPFLDAGGFGPVSQSLTEDVALARHIARRGGTVRFVDGSALLDVIGYGSAAAAWAGWGRSLALGDVTPAVSQAADLALLWTVVAAPLPRLLLGRGDVLDAVLLLVRVSLLFPLAGTYRRRGLGWWLSPLADAAVVARLTAATVRPVRTWRGRTYGRVRAPRPGVPPSQPSRSATR